MSHLVHLAGQPVRAANLVRQRCAWCGALVDEVDLDERIAYQTEQGPPPSPIDEDGNPIARWSGLVAIEEHGEHAAVGFRGRWRVEDPADGKIPEDSCMALPPEATR